MNTDPKSNLMTTARTMVQIRALEEKIRKLRKRNGFSFFSSGMQLAEARNDLTLDIDLALYLSVVGTPKEPQLKTFAWESESENRKGVKCYMRYAPFYVGTVPGKPPTHVWIESATKAVWQTPPVPITPAPGQEWSGGDAKDYEFDVLQRLEVKARATTSDAQALIDAHGDIVTAGFAGLRSPSKTADMILAASIGRAELAAEGK